MTTTARAALEQGRETRRLDGDRYFVRVSLAFEDWRAKADEASAKANLLRADLNYLLANPNWMWLPALQLRKLLVKTSGTKKELHNE